MEKKACEIKFIIKGYDSIYFFSINDDKKAFVDKKTE